eukprot:g6406.t1
MGDGRRRRVFRKTLRFAVTTACGGIVLSAASLPLASAATSSSSSGSGGGGGSGVSSSACSGVAERCAADLVCTGCTVAIGTRRERRSRRRLQQQSGDDDADDDGEQQQQEEPEESTELCSSRYPILVSGSGISFCERVGAAKCCEFSDNDAAATCMDDPLSAEYWGCFLMDEVSCDLSDMPCHSSHRATASPTAAPVFVTPSPTVPPIPAPTAAPTAAATAAPTAAPTAVATVATPSPTAGSRGGLGVSTPVPTVGLEGGELDTDDGVDIDVNEGAANGAARVVAFGRRGTAALASAVGVGVVVLSAGSLGVPFLVL